MGQSEEWYLVRRLFTALGGFGVLVLLISVAWQESGSVFAGALTGDASCDGRVDSIDAALILQADAGIVQTLPCPDNANVDFYSGLTSQDALLILQYHAGLLPLLPPDALQNIPTECPATASLSDGTVIANELLSASSLDLLLDRRQRDALATEINATLLSIRSLYPNVADVHARPHYPPGVIFINGSPEFVQRIRDLVAGGSKTVTLITGEPAFDLLNARLSLRGFHVFTALSALIACFDDHLNVPAAETAYDGVDGVLSAHRGLTSDGPDVRAVPSAGTWYVLFRDASGDCLAGCISEELFYFTVEENVVSPVASDDAMNSSIFQSLLCQVSPRHCR